MDGWDLSFYEVFLTIVLIVKWFLTLFLSDHYYCYYYYHLCLFVLHTDRPWGLEGNEWHSVTWHGKTNELRQDVTIQGWRNQTVKQLQRGIFEWRKNTCRRLTGSRTKLFKYLLRTTCSTKYLRNISTTYFFNREQMFQHPIAVPEWFCKSGQWLSEALLAT